MPEIVDPQGKNTAYLTGWEPSLDTGITYMALVAGPPHPRPFDHDCAVRRTGHVIIRSTDRGGHLGHFHPVFSVSVPPVPAPQYP